MRETHRYRCRVCPQKERATSRSEAVLSGDDCSIRVGWLPMVLNIMILLHYLVLISSTFIVLLLPPANEVWGKVMFLHLSVILFTGGGGLHPGGLHLGRSTSRGLGRPPLDADPPEHYGIQSTSRWYASYWNAFLFITIIIHGIYKSMNALNFSFILQIISCELHINRIPYYWWNKLLLFPCYLNDEKNSPVPC